MKDLKQFIGIYPVSKTLRFELRPVGKTQEWIEKNRVLENDESKAADYPVVKKLIDEYHKVCIRESMKDVHLDWAPLKEAMEEYQKKKSDDAKKRLEAEQTMMRKRIATAIKDFRHYKELTAATPSDLITSVLPEFSDNEALKSFRGFASYFIGFQENRNNIYSPDAISTGVPYRLVHDNFPKFLSNLEVYDKIKATCPEVIQQASEEIQPFLEGVMIDDIFSLDFYNSLLTQDGIDFFNRVIGGVSEEDKQKYRGINEFSNLYRQQHKELAGSKKALTMIPLFKQILSDRDTLSYIPAQIETENELMTSISQFYKHITYFERDGKTINVLNELVALLSKIDTYNPDGICVTANKLTDISQKVFGKWSIIEENLKEKAVQQFCDISVAKNKKKVDAYLSRKAYCLSDLCFDDEFHISQYFSDLPQTLNAIEGYWLQFNEWCKNDEKQKFLNNPAGTEVVKSLLDAMMELSHKCSVLVMPEEYEVDKSFYNEFIPLYEELDTLFLLYNKVRNYLTRKPSDVKKFKLNFETPSLADGWDQNKERANKAILLFKDGLSYLGIMNAQNMPNLNQKWSADESHYSKMVYKLIPGPNKMLPKVFFSKKGLDIFNPSRHILRIKEEETFKKGSPNFKLADLHDLIDFYKDGINRHPDWSKFNFQFADTKAYEDIAGFYRDIANQAYKITFSDIPVWQINDWIDNGQLYLFQLYNKDYAEGAHGRKNLHTLYWENLFTDENLSNLVLKLNGQAELFCRPQSIKKPVSHKMGSKMLNRRDKSGMPIPESIYRSLYQFYNGKKKESELTAAEKQYMDQVIVKDVTHEIIKDRRYTRQEYFFHVPLTFNANAEGNEYINENVLNYLKDNPDVNIIGIDRGERHLIYLTLINQRGEILMQKTFNVVNSYNYQAKLEQREKERDEARKSWDSVGKIKDLKEGFLSAVIHEICKMMIENNAIVVLEDLNFGFKRGRFKVERQVYQKFEKMLIDKLNYLSFKDREAEEDGGILRGYQMAQKFVSFQRLGKQSGFLFYIPAAYTSKIDPITGFVNHFNFNDITNAEKRKEFLMKMERIEMRNGNIEFEFDYRKFKTFQTDYQNLWTVSTYGKRIVMRIDDKGYKQMVDYEPTKDIVNTFKNKGIQLTEGSDLKALIADIEANATNAGFFNTLLYAFQKTLQMRNSNAATEEDFIFSPVARDGRYFCSMDEANKGRDAQGNWVSKLPIDADANGAYHIALKGLYLLRNPETKKIENEKWLQFMVEKPYLE
ncbi:MAG: type V CRISPR-associated protein Cas12a/Cpf1 [Prevotella sp.]|nr:type V CRISPR-associated protein Cas12a/Cpf1 [Prevotella sp.]